MTDKKDRIRKKRKLSRALICDKFETFLRAKFLFNFN